MPARTIRIDGRARHAEQREHRQHERLRLRRAARARRDERDRRQHVEPGEEEQDQQRADHELGQRDHGERADGDPVVGQRRPARSAANEPSRSASGTMSSVVIAARMNEFASLSSISSQIGISPPCA